MNATPVSSIVYTITGSTAAGCTDDTTFSITVHPVPAISVRPDTTVCEGVSLELWVTGTDTYRWTPGAVFGNRFRNQSQRDGQHRLYRERNEHLWLQHHRYYLDLGESVARPADDGERDDLRR